ARPLSTPLMVALARRVFAGHRSVDQAGMRPERLADRAALPTRESIEAMLLDAFVPAVLRDDAQARVKGRGWPTDRAQRWLRFLARRLAARGEHDLIWSRLAGLVPDRWPIVAGAFRP